MNGTDPVASGSVISLPKGGGAISGLGEKFSPDLFTGTGNFSVPIALPPGRHGVGPQLALAYSTGEGNGAFGMGWRLSLPGVARKTSRGIPRYRDASPEPDVFVLSGAEDLVPVSGSGSGRVRYRPRTEGLFARIEHIRDATGDYWEVRSKDGMLTRYGTPRPAGADATWRDPAAVYDPGPGGQNRIFGWRITETRDPLGNLIRYEYRRDRGEQPGHLWDQPLLSRISYADYGDRKDPAFLVSVELDYETRPDPFSDYRAGFEIRTTLRCSTIRVVTHAADHVDRTMREQRFSYEQAPFNGVSLLSRVEVVGIDEQSGPPQHLPPLSFGYSRFDPAGRRFEPLTGPGLPTAPLNDRSLALVDLRGNGLPDVVELGATKRYWTNRGEGRFALPRLMTEAPAEALTDPGVQFLDADGDGRPDLLVTSGAQAGYFPLSFSGGWSRRSFQPYRQVPSVGLGEPRVKLVDLDGDGLTDVLRSGTRLECWFNDADPRLAWQRTTVGELPDPSLDLADPHVRLADMTGDGLQDIVLLYNGNIAYWPNLGHGRWGRRVQMRGAPRLPTDYNPQRVLLGDVDGDGLADFVYVDHGRVLVWGNQTGNGWTEQPVTITGTPEVSDADAIRLADLRGTGMGGLLWSRASNGSGAAGLRFLDFTGGRKPYLLDTMDNHLGAQTTVQYLPSTVFFLRDEADPATRWRTTLPFPVHVVAHVEVYDQISFGRLTTEYRYHHGYWDGVEREFRGFAMVEQLDTETFHDGGVHYSPPTLTKSWFHPGPVAAAEAGDWAELDLSHEYWPGDTPMLTRPAEMTAFLNRLPRRARRDALRALRGQLLRSELYALDGTDRQDRPYTVTESLSGVREESPPAAAAPQRQRIFFVFGLGQRTTQWERGADPMTQFTFPAGHDAYGFATGQLTIAVPRGRDPRTADARAAQPYLATYATTEYVRRDDTDHYLVDRVARTTSYEVRNDGRSSVFALRDAVLTGPATNVSLRVTGHSRSFYDGPAYAGLPLGQLGDYGLVVRTESLAFPDSFLDELFDPADPLRLSPRPSYLDPGGGTAWGPEYPDEFRTLMPAQAGYVHYRDADVPGSPGGYYITSARHLYDVHDPGRVPRGLLLKSLDPLGAQSGISYDDQHNLFVTATVDPAGLVTRAGYDLRVLQVREVRDANGNSSVATFSPAGFVTAHYLHGKNGEGDATTPSVRLDYDLLAFTERGQPVSVRTVHRVHHDTQTDVLAGQRDEVIVSMEYSDGFGRLLQTRTQAEDTLFGDPVFGGGVIPADQTQPVTATVGRTRQPSEADNVVVSGWQIYDNKGQVVEKYEPFFATGWDFAAPRDAELGQKATLFYDPRGHVIRTRNPDSSEQLVVFGVPVDLADPDVFAPTPWESFTYDANDNAGRTHASVAQGYRSHWNTPASIEIDALGRTVVATARNNVSSGPDWYITHSTYDIQGNLIAITDALGRPAFDYRFDLAKRRWRTDSIDAGRRDSVPDALGAILEGRDSKGALTLNAFDLLHRPIRVWARDDTTGPVTLRQRIDYGDAGTPNQPAGERQAAQAHNLLGHPTAHYDEAGLVTIVDIDFKGNILDSTRRVIADAPILAVYQQAATQDWQVTPFQVDWQPAAGQTRAQHEAELLETTSYQTTTSFDALNRVVRQILPQDVEGQRRELRPGYNRAGVLEQVRLGDTVYVERIAYDAKGQRALITYGNGVMTRYAYDPRTFRLTRLRSEHYTLTGTTYQPGGEVLQDYGYDYDLAGNILTIRDRTPGSGIPSNPGAFSAPDPAIGRLLAQGDALDRRFTYDPIYRLRTANGRECAAPPAGDPWLDLPRCTDVTRTRAYTETYTYDSMGNMLQLAHTATDGFTRDFTIAPDSNRLQRMKIGQTPYDYAFDANGNMRSEATSRHFTWNHADQLTTFATQTHSVEPSIHAHYMYDAAGQRVKKLVRKQGGQIEVTHYIDATFDAAGQPVKELVRKQGDQVEVTHYIDSVFEHHRWDGQSQGRENNHVHVMDATRRVALVRLGPAHPDDRAPAIQFHLSDHLGSSNVVLDPRGALVNREEYTPYGETSFGSFSRKRYRLTGMERDEESGLTYHGARYYEPHLNRWISADPLSGPKEINGYEYCTNNPLRYVDPGGQESSSPPEGYAGYVWFSVRHNIVARRVGWPEKRPNAMNYNEPNLSSLAKRFSSSLNLKENAPQRGSEKNALRHAIWQGFILREFGVDMAKKVGDLHEKSPDKDTSKRVFELDRSLSNATSSIQGWKLLEDADETVDLLNNERTRTLSKSLPDTNKGLVKYYLDLFRTEGLYVADITHGPDNISITRIEIKLQKLSKGEYLDATARLNNLTENGLTANQEKQFEEKASAIQSVSVMLNPPAGTGY